MLVAMSIVHRTNLNERPFRNFLNETCSTLACGTAWLDMSQGSHSPPPASFPLKFNTGLPQQWPRRPLTVTSGEVQGDTTGTYRTSTGRVLSDHGINALSTGAATTDYDLTAVRPRTGGRPSPLAVCADLWANFSDDVAARMYDPHHLEHFVVRYVQHHVRVTPNRP